MRVLHQSHIAKALALRFQGTQGQRWKFLKRGLPPLGEMHQRQFTMALDTRSEIRRRMLIAPPHCLTEPLEVPGGPEGRLLLGPGPANCSTRVREALAKPLLGHLHPEFIKVMDDAKEGLRYLFQTTAPIVCCFSGTGHSGMEGMICNLLEGDEVLLVVDTGIWGQRAADMARRQGIDVRVAKCAAGQAISPSQLEEAVKEHKPNMVLVVHVESSTGVLQPLEGLGAVCRKYGALCCVDTVASLGGAPFLMDEWQVDAVYTGTQKVLNAPPGLAPCALNQRAREKLESRKTPVRSFYFDLKELANYWGCDDSPRRYHHTGPISTIYALREALAELTSAGLQSYWSRHRDNAKRLCDGLESLELELYVPEERLRAPTVTTVKVPAGVDWKEVAVYIMKNYQIEISGGLGTTAGLVWRVGLMGLNSSEENVEKVLSVLKEALKRFRPSNKL